MKVAFVSIGSFGLLMPLLGAAEEAARRGHTPVFVTHGRAREFVQQAGFRFIEGASDGEGLNIEGWWTPRQAVPQFEIVSRAVFAEQPDALVVDHFAVGGIMAARAAGVPVAVLGPAAYIHPIAAIPAGVRSAGIRNARYARLVAGYNESAHVLGLPQTSEIMNDNSPFLGDRYLLRSVPLFEAFASALPERVRFVGACLRNSTDHDDSLAAWIRASDAPIVFLQIEKLFDFDDPIPVLLDLAEAQGMRIAAALGENAAAYGEYASPALFIRPHLPQAQALGSARIAISTGHAMAVLGAICAGVPNLILDFGSGAPELLHCCESAGVGAGLPGMRADAQLLGAVLERLLGDDAMTANARRLQRAFGAVDSFAAVADVLDELIREPRTAATLG